MKLKDLVERAVKQWSEGVSERTIRNRVFSMLDKGRDEIIYKMAGFNTHWSAWEVDHCNGRVSVISGLVKKLAKEAVEAWIKKNLDPLPEMSEELRSAFLDDYKRVYKQELSREILDLAQRQASSDARKIVDAFVVEDIEFEDEDTDAETPEWE